MFQSYLSVAEEFKRLDNLEYARQALDKALTIYPDSISVASQRFAIAATELLREADFLGAMSIDDQEQTEITALVQDGFRLLQLPLARAERSELLTQLGRLLTYDSTWADSAWSHSGAADELFAEAVQLTPSRAEALFWHGHHLLGSENPQTGFDRIQAAIRLAPDNPLFLAELGEHLLTVGRFREALQPLQNAAALNPDELSLQQVRAINDAKRNLAKWLLKADNQVKITDDDFFGLSADARDQLVTTSLTTNASNRALNYLAARWFNHHQQPDKALAALKNSLYDQGSLQTIPSSDLEKLPLYLQLLTTLNIEPATRASLTEVLQSQ